MTAEQALALGRVPEGWLSDLTLSEGEAHLSIVLGQRPTGRAVAAIAFDTLKRRQPDTASTLVWRATEPGWWWLGGILDAPLR